MIFLALLLLEIQCCVLFGRFPFWARLALCPDYKVTGLICQQRFNGMRKMFISEFRIVLQDQ